MEGNFDQPAGIAAGGLIGDDTETPRLLRTLVEAAPLGVAIIDRDMRFVFVNERLAAMNGPAPEAHLGRSVAEVVPGLVHQLQPLFEHVLATGEPVLDREIWGETARAPGERRAWLESWYPVRDDSGAVAAVGVMVLDVTERRQQEHERVRLTAELERQRRLLDSITRNASLALFVMDERQQCVFMNPAAEAMTGYTLEEVRNRPLHDVIHHTRPDGRPYPLAECPIDRAFPEQMQQQGEEVFVHRDGRFYPVAFTASPIRDKGRIVGTVIEVRDITEEKRAAEALRRAADERQRLLDAEQHARREAERVNRMKDEFLATLSHEIRTPLNAIVGWSQLLKSGRLAPDAVARAVEVIERNAKAQARLIDDLLDMNRIVSGKVRLDVQAIDPVAVVAAALDSVQPTADAKGVRLEQVNDADAGRLRADAARLQQVVWNLLTNAIKFTPRGGTVRVSVRRAAGHVEIAVSDTGQGISREFLPYVFERFTQADGSIRRPHGGLGLGLSIVRELVEMHNGTVRAASAGEGRGATFTVTLPLAAQAHEARSETAAAAPAGGEDCDPAAPSRLDGLRVLLVEDDEDARDLARRVLESHGAAVRAAGTAGEALEAVQREPFHVVVSDIGMPNTDGYEFVRRLRGLAAGRARSLPAIALTAFARAEDRERALAAGYQAHLVKPLDARALVETVAALAGACSGA